MSSATLSSIRKISLQSSRRLLATQRPVLMQRQTLLSHVSSAMVRQSQQQRLYSAQQQQQDQSDKQKQKIVEQQREASTPASATAEKQEVSATQHQQNEGAEPQLSSLDIVGKIKQFVKKYGILGVVIYFAVYFLTLASIYLFLAEGWLNGQAVYAKLKSWGLDKLFHVEKDEEEQMKSMKTANFALAWVLTKFTEPIRFAVTVAITPWLYKLLKLSRFVR